MSEFEVWNTLHHHVIVLALLHFNFHQYGLHRRCHLQLLNGIWDLYGPAQKIRIKSGYPDLAWKNIRKSGFEKVDGYCKPYSRSMPISGDRLRFVPNQGDAVTNMLRMYHGLPRFLKSWTIGTKDRDSVTEALVTAFAVWCKNRDKEGGGGDGKGNGMFRLGQRVAHSTSVIPQCRWLVSRTDLDPRCV